MEKPEKAGERAAIITVDRATCAESPSRLFRRRTLWIYDLQQFGNC